MPDTRDVELDGDLVLEYGRKQAAWTTGLLGSRLTVAVVDNGGMAEAFDALLATLTAAVDDTGTTVAPVCLLTSDDPGVTTFRGDVGHRWAGVLLPSSSRPYSDPLTHVQRLKLVFACGLAATRDAVPEADGTTVPGALALPAIRDTIDGTGENPPFGDGALAADGYVEDDTTEWAWDVEAESKPAPYEQGFLYLPEQPDPLATVRQKAVTKNLGETLQLRIYRTLRGCCRVEHHALVGYAWSGHATASGRPAAALVEETRSLPTHERVVSQAFGDGGLELSPDPPESLLPTLDGVEAGRLETIRGTTPKFGMVPNGDFSQWTGSGSAEGPRVWTLAAVASGTADPANVARASGIIPDGNDAAEFTGALTALVQDLFRVAPGQRVLFAFFATGGVPWRAELSGIADSGTVYYFKAVTVDGSVTHGRWEENPVLTALDTNTTRVSGSDRWLYQGVNEDVPEPMRLRVRFFRTTQSASGDVVVGNVFVRTVAYPNTEGSLSAPFDAADATPFDHVETRAPEHFGTYPPARSEELPDPGVLGPVETTPPLLPAPVETNNLASRLTGQTYIDLRSYGAERLLALRGRPQQPIEASAFDLVYPDEALVVENAGADGTPDDTGRRYVATHLTLNLTQRITEGRWVQVPVWDAANQAWSWDRPR
ncbi:MAG: hypothetical protein AAGG50_03725 [Bacteroidota bacterium]